MSQLYFIRNSILIIPASMKYKVLSLTILFYSFTFGQTANRAVLPLTDGWQFSFVTNVYKNQKSITVSIPHTWNATEVKNASFNYQRTSAVYRKTIFIDSADRGKRFFLLFEGANSVADLFVNKRYVGEHKGGYTKFTFEITPFIHPGQNNDINVMVSNAYRLDVLPMSGDFNVYGGLHRPVSLLVTNENCITPLDYASAGVYVTPRHISNRSADVQVLSKLSLNNPSSALRVRTTLLNQKGEAVQVHTASVSGSSVEDKFTINNPHLWNGKADPYLYSARVELLQGQQVIDRVSQSFGIRTYSVDPEKGFFLNGSHLDLHGVAYHEDVEGKGSAYTMTDYEKDFDLFKEIGLTAVRFAHYPHGQPAYDLADESGIVLWTEIPFIGSGGFVGEGYANSEAFHQHARNMLTEMIRQNYNHPAIFFWGLFNELTANFDSPAPFLKELDDLAHKEDPSRLTTCADMLDRSPFDSVSDVKAWNKYFGWYSGKVENFGAWLDNMHKKIPMKPFGISEYGGGASIHQHTDSLVQTVPTSKFHPEEWQTYLHERSWEQLSARPYLWGKFIWVLADFGSTGRNEGDTLGINDKGLVTYDKQTRKDAFYFYKVNWNRNQPTVYITEKRNTIRHQQQVKVEVFSNMPEVELSVNGKSLGRKTPDNFKRATWENVSLQKGNNTVLAKVISKDGVLADSCIWEYR
jgi:beta-galactosidase